jgi:hypothetical protein
MPSVRTVGETPAAHLERWVSELGEMLGRYAAGEYEIAKSYLTRSRSREGDIHWIREQAGREAAITRMMVNDLARRFAQLDKGVPRGQFEADLRKAMEEFRHFRLLTDVLEKLVGFPIQMKWLEPWSFYDPNPLVGEHGETCKLARLEREAFKQFDPEVDPTPSDEMLALAVELLEGGGCGVFLAASEVRGSALDDEIAGAFRVIVQDELRHGPTHLAEIGAHVRTDAEFERLREAVRLVGNHRLRFRNEMFGRPLAEDRLQEIEAGRIEPLRIDYRAVTGVSPYSA